MADDWKKKEPSEKQLSLIKTLGSSETPKTMGEASALISSLMQKKKFEKLIKESNLGADIKTAIEKSVDESMNKQLFAYSHIALWCYGLGLN